MSGTCWAASYGLCRISTKASADNRAVQPIEAVGSDEDLVSPRAADGCIRPVIRKPLPATPTSPVALLLPQGLGLLLCAGNQRPDHGHPSVPEHDCFHHSGVAVPAVPMPRQRSPHPSQVRIEAIAGAPTSG